MTLTALLVLSTTYSVSASELENIEKVEGGYFLSDESIIALANHIQDLQDENTRLQAQVDALNNALQEERVLVGQLLAEKDRIIAMQERQIEDLKFMYKNSNTTFDKANLLLGGAGIAAAIILIATTIQ